ncbi:acyl-[acyl-carrier-protein]--UDP-N-acetylglucosamine O-acyltransferase [Sinobacterium caligoides]|uniref:Acyl-[acyl-carrier-protein]--UDP-N-acetylglucosamine O-acyltransferase n=1 Tax=Sinobacterium caligoides TaxID=933926 RepID=A0A3N2DMJ8_9GAMM|nr:acyl-ACP--UDP-N-acetylglucosamine O-acyltransferase [Sinobacterium caligoides]ROS01036.1 acyl-[acyl-carrier-protein]--UDP-N-acetylglucosamine O-acyltransferase [Sinobacterium caligoides]
MIDPRAIVDASAKIADGVEIGPWTIVGADVEIGEGSVISSHVVLKGPTKIGRNNRIYQFSTIGDDTPDLKYKGEETRLVIGDNNVIREGVTIHRGTIQDRSETTIGDNNLLMAYVHVGHDSVIGDHTILVNNAALAGHVVVGDHAIVAGYALIHQYCQIGAHSFVGMGSGVAKDVTAYTTVMGAPAEAKGINSEGLRRRGFSKEAISAIKQAYRITFRQGLTVDEALQQLRPMVAKNPEVELYIDSLNSSTRGIVR